MNEEEARSGRSGSTAEDSIFSKSQMDREDQDGGETRSGGGSKISNTFSSATAVELSSEDVKHKILTEKAKMNIRPHLKNTTRDYLTMIREENDFKNKPEWDSYQQCLMFDMVESRRNNQLACEMLEKKRRHQAVTRLERDREIKELELNERMFGASFVFFDRFVKENMEKRDRALEKITTEKAIRAEIEQQIIKTDSKIKKLWEVKSDMGKCINDRKIFVDFLENVRALAPNEFRNGVHEIADRYEVWKYNYFILCNMTGKLIQKLVHY